MKFSSAQRQKDTVMALQKSLAGVKIAGEQHIQGNMILVLGHIASFDKGTCNFIKQISNRLGDHTFFLLSETPKMTAEQIQKKTEMDFAILPRVSYAGGYDSSLNVNVPQQVRELLLKKPYLQGVVQNLRGRFQDMGDGYAELLTAYFYQYCQTAITSFQPKGVIIWNQFTAMHTVMVHVCKEHSITPVFFEFGVFPGTFSLELSGEMGESWVAKNPEKLLEKEVLKEELEQTKKVLEFVRETRLNRNIQPILNNSDLSGIKKGRPIILYLGQSDYESGLYPYTENTRTFHSPTYQSSEEALWDLAQIAEENDWNLIYKPHPAMIRLNQVSKAINNVMVVEQGNFHDLIDLSDVVVTILSQGSYEALIRKKPVVMLGYNQLRGKGCTYEAFSRENLLEQLSKAITNGFSTNMEKAFNIHIAQMLKYYLYDDLVKREMRFGQTLEQCVADLFF